MHIYAWSALVRLLIDIQRQSFCQPDPGIGTAHRSACHYIAGPVTGLHAAQ